MKNNLLFTASIALLLIGGPSFMYAMHKKVECPTPQEAYGSPESNNGQRSKKKKTKKSTQQEQIPASSEPITTEQEQSPASSEPITTEQEQIPVSSEKSTAEQKETPTPDENNAATTVEKKEKQTDDTEITDTATQNKTKKSRDPQVEGQPGILEKVVGYFADPTAKALAKLRTLQESPKNPLKITHDVEWAINDTIQKTETETASQDAKTILGIQTIVNNNQKHMKNLLELLKLSKQNSIQISDVALGQAYDCLTKHDQHSIEYGKMVAQNCTDQLKKNKSGRTLIHDTKHEKDDLILSDDEYDDLDNLFNKIRKS